MGGTLLAIAVVHSRPATRTVVWRSAAARFVVVDQGSGVISRLYQEPFIAFFGCWKISGI